MGELYLRKVTENDIDLLFKWANDPMVRENSFNSEPIEYEEHKNWFNDKLKSNQSWIYILEKNKTPAGQIRIDIEEEKGVINYSIAKNFRGEGLGTKILKLVTERVKKDDLPIEKLEGEVKSGNIPSIKCFRKAEYKEEKKNDIYIFSKKLEE